ncbi:hypothetical protein DUNSADRAFT_3778 [Dunaliella salina]|uniref:Encoded protein n=1 Tax=Dunaliella salina TaxID=3046 RepID=A0ABQ7FVA9_DUNSA|nr:hypothetical protein DUNSADRAFT_3778 [Dunaliella salina]|eukprot:KAF5826283.1 hypothetical protein DUNSADRAFT_3778 [Dunaliella salina]
MGLAYFEVYAALCGLPGTGAKRSHPGALQHRDKEALWQGRQHWMASSHANGEPPPARRSIAERGTNANGEKGDMLVGSSAGNAEVEPAMLGHDSIDADPGQLQRTSGRGRGRHGSRRRSGGQASDARVLPPAGTTPSGRSKSAGRQGGYGGSRGAAEEVATPPPRGSLRSPLSQRGRGRGRGSASKQAAVSGWEGVEGVSDEATPPHLSQSVGEVGDEGGGSIAQRVRARRRRSGGAP